MSTDTTVWLALIAAVVAVVSLLINTYGTIQIERIKQKQIVQDGKIEDVKHAANGKQAEQTKLVGQMKRLLIEANLLDETSADAAVDVLEEEKVHKVVVVNPEDVPVPVSDKSNEGKDDGDGDGDGDGVLARRKVVKK